MGKFMKLLANLFILFFGVIGVAQADITHRVAGTVTVSNASDGDVIKIEYRGGTSAGTHSIELDVCKIGHGCFLSD